LTLVTRSLSITSDIPGIWGDNGSEKKADAKCDRAFAGPSAESVLLEKAVSKHLFSSKFYPH
jgi:hypothetical protein